MVSCIGRTSIKVYLLKYVQGLIQNPNEIWHVNLGKLYITC